MECHMEYFLNGNTNSIFWVPGGFFKHIYVCTQKLTTVHQCTYTKELHEDYSRNHLMYGLVNCLEIQ